MTAVPPPVPPEIAWAALTAVRRHIYEDWKRSSDVPGWHACTCGWEGYWCDWQPHLSERVLAAVYGDIVEAESDAEIARLRGELERTEKMVDSLAVEYLAKHGQASAERDAALAEVERLRRLVLWHAPDEYNATTDDAVRYVRSCEQARENALAEVERLRWAASWSDLSDERIALIDSVMRESRFEDLLGEAEAERDRAVRDARRDALDQATDAITALGARRKGDSSLRGLTTVEHAARIVAGLRDSEATG